jgi:putative phage-type endonuclease
VAGKCRTCVGDPCEHYCHTARKPPTAIMAPTQAEWLAARRKGVTASEIAVVMGMHPASWDTSPFTLYQRKVGNIPDQDDSDQFAYGRHMEPFIAERFTARYPEFALEGNGEQLFAHPDRPWQMATPDRIAFDAGALPDIRDCTHGADCELHPDAGQLHNFDDLPLPRMAQAPLALVQCKTAWPNEDWGDEGSDEIPLYYRMQVLWELDVMGVLNAFVPTWFQGSYLRVYEVVLDDLAQRELALMRDAATMFLARIKTAEPPPVDWQPGTRKALAALYSELDDVVIDVPHQLAVWWNAARRDLDLAKKRKSKYEAELRLAMRTSRRARDNRTGVVFARRDRFEVAEKMIKRKAGTTDRLMPVGGKKKAG